MPRDDHTPDQANPTARPSSIPMVLGSFAHVSWSNRRSVGEFIEKEMLCSQIFHNKF